jgi:hypothetical protein
MMIIQKPSFRRSQALKVAYLLALSLVIQGFLTQFGVAGTPAEDQASMKELCANLPCRGKTRIVLRLNKDKVYDKEFEQFNPVVMGSDITVLPGETLLVEAEERAGRLENLKPVVAMRVPERTLVIKFKQRENSVNMALTVSNPFPRHLRYSIGMIVPGQDGALQTSSCPAIPKGQAFEQWPHPIFQLIIRDLVLLSEDNPELDCR